MKKEKRFQGYLIALAAVATATLARWLLAPLLGEELPLITYYLAVVAVAWLASLGPALATLLAGAVLAELLFASMRNPAGFIDLARYFIVGGAIIAASGALRAAHRRADRHEALLASTVRNALDCIVVMDHQGRVMEFNEAAQRAFGYSRAEAVGQDLAALIIPERYRERHRGALARYLETGVNTVLDRRVEIEAMRADGSEFPVELSVTRIQDSDPPIFTGYIRDISAQLQAQRELRESDKRFTEVIDQLRDYAIFLTDTKGRATSWNEGVRRVLGFDEAEFVGLDVRAIFTPEDVQAGVPEEELAVATERGTAGDDRWMMRKDGIRFFAIGVTVSRRDEAGTLLGFAKIMRDQTARKELEEELRETASHLAKANQQQGHFLAMLSHELRNPLAPIRNGVAILRMSGDQGRDGQAVVEMIGRQVNQLVRLIDDLLDINRIRGGKIRLRKETIDLVPSLTQAVEIAQAQCSNSGQRFSVDLAREPLWVDADPARIGQVVSNLVHNASKFTPRDGHVHLGAAREGAHAVIRVRDSGMGIPFDQLERIFGMFEQLDSAQGHAHGGLGIGLSLSKSLIEMQGGTIEARSEGHGQGSEFIVRLPLLAAPGTQRAANPPPAVTRARRVLVVDDNRDAADSLAAVVRMNGHQVHCAHDGEEALAKAAEHRPEIVLLDIGLPKLDGYQVAQRLRAEPAGRELVLVAVTGWGQEEDVQRALDAGFDVHITKPIDYDALLGILARS